MYQTQINIIRIDDKDLRRLQRGKAINIALTNGSSMELQYDEDIAPVRKNNGDMTKAILKLIKANMNIKDIKSAMNGKWDKYRKLFYNLVYRGVIKSVGSKGKKTYSIA